MAATQALKYLVTADTGGFVKSMGGLKGIAIAAGAAIAAAFAKAISITADFQEALARLEALSGATKKNLKALEQQAKQLGATTASTATEIVGLQTELAKLGFSTREIIDSTPGIRNFADALEVDVSDAASLAGASIRAFGLDASETNRVVDTFSYAAANSALDFTKLSESMKYAGPIANLYGRSIEETTAQLAALANQNIFGSQAGTALRNIYLELDKKGVSLSEAFDQVNKSANPASLALKLVGKRSAAALAILADGRIDVDKFTEALENAEGATKKIAETKLDQLKGDWKLLASATSALAVEIGEIFIPILRVLVKALTKVVTWIQKALINVKIFFKNVAVAFLNLSASTLGVIKNFREFLGLKTDKLDTQISNVKTSIEGLNSEIDILKGKKIDLDDDTKSTTHSNTGGGSDEQERIISAPVLEIEPVLSTTYEQAAEWQEHARKIVEAFSQAWNIETKNLGQLIVPGSIEIGNALKASIAKPVEEVKELANEAGQALSAAAASAFSGLGVAIGEALAGQGDIGEKFLKLIGTFMVQFGSALVALGIAEAAWISSLDPVTKIIAGGALIIAGALISAVAKKKPGNKGSAPLPSSNPTATTTTPQSVQGEGAGGALVATVRGQDLRFVLQSADSNYNALN